MGTWNWLSLRPCRRVLWRRCGLNPPKDRVNGWVLAMLDLRPAAARLCAWLWSRAEHAVVSLLRQVPRGRTPEDADGTGLMPSLGEKRETVTWLVQ